ncbi:MULTISPECIES: hypothetical protein [unclassified Frankia]
MRPRPAPSPAAPLTVNSGGQGRVSQDRAGQGHVGNGRAGQLPDASDGPGRLPTEAEAAAITAAVFDSPLVSRVSPDGLRITGIRTSTGAPDWAFAVLSPPGGTDPAIAVLRWDTSCGWVLDQVGTARVGIGGGAAGRHDDLPCGAITRRRGAGVRRGCESGIRPGDAARPG